MADDKIAKAGQTQLTQMDGNIQMQELLKHAMEQGADGVAALEKLVGLQERMLDRQAVQAFNGALSEFRAKCPPIKKNKKVRFATRGGTGQAGYDYPELEYIDAVVKPVAERCGLSYTWESKLSEDGRFITETFVLTHSDGHTQRTPFTAPTDTSNKLMSPQQRAANAGTYCMRQAMIRGLGLVAINPDNDSMPPSEDLGYITEEQAANIEALLTELGEDQRPKFLKAVGADSVEEIPANKYTASVRALEKKRAAQ